MFKRIINIGVSDLKSEVLNRKIRISNLIAVLTLIILASFLPLAIYLHYALSLGLLFFFAAASFVNFYCHSKGHHQRAFYIYTLCGFFYFIGSTLIFGLVSNLHFFMLIMCMICVIIFDNMVVLKSFIAFAIISFFTLRWYMGDKEGFLHMPANMSVIQETSGNIILLLLFITSSIFFVFFKNDNLAFQLKIIHQKEIIEEKNKDITASITYAKRLQEAILPSKQMLAMHLADSFVLYQPKDIVAGDFYWMEFCASPSESVGEGANAEMILFAAADCTGHGVPGAMVSVVCSNALNRAVKEFDLTDPGKILDKVRELVLQTFEKSESEVKDGMDISLLRIDGNRNELKWAGANNPMLLIRDGQLTEYKPDKQPIGKTDSPVPFTTHTIPLQKGDLIYTFTDGFADQFGGPKGKKFKYAQLKELLLRVHRSPMIQQSEKIREELLAWKGQLEQVDDVLITGIRI
ncbi:MAG: PP2C family protein-serine/threonine phosphatase [Bacteroidia bacterium]